MNYRNRHWVTRHHKAEQTDVTTEYFTRAAT